MFAAGANQRSPRAKSVLIGPPPAAFFRGLWGLSAAPGVTRQAVRPTLAADSGQRSRSSTRVTELPGTTDSQRTGRAQSSLAGRLPAGAHKLRSESAYFPLQRPTEEPRTMCGRPGVGGSVPVSAETQPAPPLEPLTPSPPCNILDTGDGLHFDADLHRCNTTLSLLGALPPPMFESLTVRTNPRLHTLESACRRQAAFEHRASLVYSLRVQEVRNLPGTRYR